MNMRERECEGVALAAGSPAVLSPASVLPGALLAELPHVLPHALPTV